MPVLIYIFVFVFGLLVGSFLNSVIYRLHTKEGIVKERSHCPKCGKILAWYELIPIFSFLAQRGRCRSCKKSISLQYPLVELFTGGLFLFIFTSYGLLVTGYLWFIVSGLIIIFVYDLRHYIIPDKILVPLILIVLIRQLADGIWHLNFDIWNSANVLTGLTVGFITALFFAALHFGSRGRAMGFGDVKLSFFMGLFLGWPNILVALFIAFNTGAIIGVSLIFAGKKSLKNQIPFGPFLILGTLSALFWGRDIINWYFNLFS